MESSGESEGQGLAEAARASTAVAHSIDYLTEAEVLALGGLERSTLIAWRKRGQGPMYVRFGTQFLYPRAALLEHLIAQTRRPRARQVEGVL